MSNLDKHIDKKIQFRHSIQGFNVLIEGLIIGVVGGAAREMFRVYTLTGPAGEMWVEPEVVVGEVIPTIKVVPLDYTA